MDLALATLDNDLIIENADLVLVRNADAVAQFLKQKLRTFQTEWFLDETAGIPYFDQIFVKNPKSVVYDSIFKEAILNTAGVVELISYRAELNGQTRELLLQFTARTNDGIIDFSEVIGV